MPSANIGKPVSFVYPIVKTIVQKGHSQEELLRKANIDSSIFQDPDARISEEMLVRITELAAELTSDELFGLHKGQSTEASDLGILGYVMQHSKTIGDALAAYQKYNVIVCSGYDLSWHVEGDDVIIMTAYAQPLQMPSRHCIEDMMSSLYHIMVRLSCRSIALKEVHFRHDRSAAAEEYMDVLGVLPQFGKESNLFRMSKEILEYPVLFADAKIRSAFELIAEEAKHRLIQGKIFSDQVYSWIINRMPVSNLSLKDAAAEFRMSVRSIQAKLKQEETTFQAIMVRARKELAIGYLAKPEYPIAEVAYLLHFSEPSAFQNAFKKWTGVTPRQYRKELLNNLYM
ncbi:AraC family transcriptional regulator [Paenibacillus tarimensis]